MSHIALAIYPQLMYKYYMKDNFYRIMNSDGKPIKVLETLEQFADYVKNLANAPLISKLVPPASTNATNRLTELVTNGSAEVQEVEAPKPRIILRRAGEKPPVKDLHSDSVSARKRLLAQSRDV